MRRLINALKTALNKALVRCQVFLKVFFSRGVVASNAPQEYFSTTDYCGLIIDYPNFEIPLFLFFNIDLLGEKSLKDCYEKEYNKSGLILYEYIDCHKKHNLCRTPKDIGSCINELIAKGYSIEKIFYIGMFLLFNFKNGNILIPKKNLVKHISENKYTYGFVKNVCRFTVEKCSFLYEFWKFSDYYFIAPTNYDNEVINKKLNDKTVKFILEFKNNISYLVPTDLGLYSEIEYIFKDTAKDLGLKDGEVKQLFRVCLTGVSNGYDLFKTADLIGIDEMIIRIENFLHFCKK